MDRWPKGKDGAGVWERREGVPREPREVNVGCCSGWKEAAEADCATSESAQRPGCHEGCARVAAINRAPIGGGYGRRRWPDKAGVVIDDAPQKPDVFHR